MLAAPAIFMATFREDYRWFVLPDGWTDDEIDELKGYNAQLLKVSDSLDNDPQWSLFRVSGKLVVGLAARVATFLWKIGVEGEDKVTDKWKRSLSCYLYLTIDEVELDGKLILRSPSQFATLLKYFQHSWNDAAVSDTLRIGHTCPLQLVSRPALSGLKSLNGTHKNLVTVGSRPDDDAFWMLAHLDGNVSLCLGLPTLAAAVAPGSKFLNTTVYDPTVVAHVAERRASTPSRLRPSIAHPNESKRATKTEKFTYQAPPRTISPPDKVNESKSSIFKRLISLFRFS